MLTQALADWNITMENVLEKGRIKVEKNEEFFMKMFWCKTASNCKFGSQKL